MATVNGHIVCRAYHKCLTVHLILQCCVSICKLTQFWHIYSINLNSWPKVKRFWSHDERSL